jgi:glycosyltransferase involved in cell wall biosynthesis
MPPLRLALVAPRFWPWMGDGPNHWLAVAESLAAAGHAVTVVTPRWTRDWPRRTAIGPLAVVRLRGSPRGGWSGLRWMYALARWLAAEPRLDGVLVAGLRQEAYVALGALGRRGIPLLVLAGAGDVAWQRSATFGSRIAARCAQAPAISAPSQGLLDELLLAGYPRERLTLIPRRVPVPPPHGPLARDQARAALAAVNYDLATTTTAPVALAVGRLDAEHAFGDLVRAWRIVAARRSEARLWIIGDGPERERLFHQISDLDQRFRVLIPGSFDCLDELLSAADLLLVPGQHLVPPLALLQALAAGLPVAAAQSAAVRECLVHERTGLLHAAGDFRAIAQLVQQIIEQPAAAVPLGAAARQASQALPTPADEAAQYITLLRGQRR